MRNNIQIAPPNVDDSAITEAVAKALAKNPENPDTESITAKFGISAAALEDHIAAHAGEIDRRTAEMIEAGDDIGPRARDTLRDVVARIGASVASANLAGLVRAGEFLNRVSGMEAQQRRQEAPQTDRVVLQIIMGDKQVDLVANAQQQADVVDVEPIDPLAGLRGALTAEGGADDD